MRRLSFLLLFVIFTIFIFPVQRFKKNVWFLKPTFNYTNIGNNPFLVFKTPIKCKLFKVSMENNEIFVLSGDDLKIYSPDFSLIKEITNLKEKMNIKGLSDIGFMAIKYFGNTLFFGVANRKDKTYYVFSYDVNSDRMRLILKLDREHFPGIAPIDKILNLVKKDPSLKSDYFNHIYKYSDFEDGFYEVGKLYMWFKPEYGMHFGGLYVYDIYNKSLIFPYKNFDILWGFSQGDYVYSILKDKDAETVDKSVYVKVYKKTFKIDEVLLNRGVVFNGENIAYASKNGYVLIKNVFNNKVLTRFKSPEGNFKLLNITFSGNRLFFDTEKGGLKYFDKKDGKIYTLITSKDKKGNISQFYSCVGGEFILFKMEGNLWAGYLPDNMAPLLMVNSRDVIRGKTFKDKISFRFKVRDTCFVSDVEDKCISFNGKVYSVKDKCVATLKEGVNNLKFFVKDRAGNVRKLEKKIVYQKPIEVSLEEISKNPLKYKGKYVLLSGYAWGWMAKDKGEKYKYNKLPLAPNNIAKSRNDGTFSDGKFTAFITISPILSGKFKIVSIIKVFDNKWRIVPIEFIKVNR